MKNILYKNNIILLVIVFILSGCMTMEVSPVTGNKRMYGYSWQDELELGKQADVEISAQYGIYEDSKVTKYVEELGEELLTVSHFNRDDTPSQYKNIPFTFRVLDSPIVNAFALPGGFVYITRGLLAHVENEAQLMVVIGHEIGHVAARHASQQQAQAQIGQLAIIGGAVLGEAIGLDGGNIINLSSTTAQLLLLSYGRDAERESDALGVEYSAMNGYVAAEGGNFFTSLKRISEKSGDNIPSHLSSHPDPGEREQTIPKLANEWANAGYKMDKINESRFRDVINGIVFDENPREGFEKNNTFYHPELKFTFPIPSGFTMVNQRSAVFLVNDKQDAIIQFSIDNENNSVKASVDNFTQNEGVTTLKQSSVKVNGYNGYVAQATLQNQDGVDLQVELTAVEYNGSIYNFLAYTTTKQFNEYSNTFNEASTGFKALTDKNILNIQPIRIKYSQASQTTAFRNLLPSTLPMNIDAADVAIINQVELDTQIEKGSWIKLPVQ